MLYKNRFLTVLSIGLATVLYPVVSNATIPVTHIKGVDELFSPGYKIYSPLTGLLQYSTFVPQMTPDKTVEAKGPLEKLLSTFFVKISADEIFASHVDKNPAAHLSASTIAKILIEFEAVKIKNLSPTQLTEELEKSLVQVIVADADYQKDLNLVKENIKTAQAKHEELLKRYTSEQLETAKAEEFKVNVYEPVTAKIKALKKKAKKPEAKEEALKELVEVEKKRVEVYQQYEQMLADYKTRGFITKVEKNKSEYDLNRFIENSDVSSPAYQESLADFAKNLATSFATYDLVVDSLHPAQHQYATTSALLSLLWIKYMDKKDLKGYLDTLSAAGFLDVKALAKTPLNEEFYNSHYIQADYARAQKSFSEIWFRKEKWVRENITDALLMSSDFSGTSKVPPIVPWSVIWSVYNLDFQDCVENVLHNLFLLITFNEKTDQFDYRILQQLKESDYPNLNQKIIDYFKAYPTHADHSTVKAAREWVDLMSGLNLDENAPEAQKIVYGIKASQRDIAGPYSNALKVLNRLFGLADLNQDRMAEIFARAYKAAHVISPGAEDLHHDYNVIYSGEADGTPSGTAYFGVGARRFRVKSYGGDMHLTFILLPSDNDETSKKITEIFQNKTDRNKSDRVKAFRYAAGLAYLRKSNAI